MNRRQMIGIFWGASVCAFWIGFLTGMGMTGLGRPPMPVEIPDSCSVDYFTRRADNPQADAIIPGQGENGARWVKCYFGDTEITLTWQGE